MKCYVNTTLKRNHTELNNSTCEYKGNTLFELLLRHSNFNQRCLVAKWQRIRIFIYEYFQLELATYSYTFLDIDSQTAFTKKCFCLKMVSPNMKS